MTADELKTVTDFESGLAVGDEVIVRWTGSHYQHKALSTIHKINDKSVIVILKELPGDYPEGQKIKAPLFVFGHANKWTANNRVEPVEGY